MSDLVLDTRRALSTTDEDELIQILREMERTGSAALVAIGVDPHTCAPWYGAVRAPDMSYTPSPYTSHMPSPHIPHMSSFDAAQMRTGVTQIIHNGEYCTNGSPCMA